METARLFTNGRSQAVRLPKDYRFEGEDVYINKIDDAVILFPKDKRWDTFMCGLSRFSDDFASSGREQGQDERRDSL
jgi:antitoxin VapB